MIQNGNSQKIQIILNIHIFVQIRRRETNYRSFHSVFKFRSFIYLKKQNEKNCKKPRSYYWNLFSRQNPNSNIMDHIHIWSYSVNTVGITFLLVHILQKYVRFDSYFYKKTTIFQWIRGNKWTVELRRVLECIVHDFIRQI